MSETPKLVSSIEINRVADGYVVYQPERDRVHYLNHTATIILELCNGRNDATTIADLLKSAYELPAVPLEEVASCLRQLSDEGLVA